VHSVFLFAAAFFASAVEMVEALTIVLAVGTTRDWRSALTGGGAAGIALAAIVAALGPALTYVPIDVLRLVVGALLLVFGMQWLRQAILRAGGYLPLHDEASIFERARAEAGSAGQDTRVGLDWYSFTLSFKGVFLEGLEVAFIVVTFGGTQRNIPLAAAAAATALVLVAAAGVLVRAPLTRIPENTLKFGVGLLLSSFGIFWSAEGTGVQWPGDELSLLGVLALLTLVSLAMVRLLQRRRSAARALPEPAA
jgi:uncharacterized membrane protein